jgi:hypothetical protein
MTPQWKRRLAKEWLTLVSGVFVGVLLLPLAVYMIEFFSGGRSAWTIGQMYGRLPFVLFVGHYPGALGWMPVGADFRLRMWLLVPIPYAIYQSVRSIIWAVTALRARQMY